MTYILEDLFTNYLYKYMPMSSISKETWDMFRENIQTHKYWLNERYDNELSLSAAYTDWQEYTFGPFLDAVDRSEVLYYTDLNLAELYKVMMTTWHYAKEATPHSHNIHIHDIVESFCITLPKYPRFRKFIFKIKNLHR